MNTSMKRISLAATLTIVASLAGTVLRAEPASEPHEITVSYADLNLARPEGLARLYRRLEAAADTVCVVADERAPSNQVRKRACIEDAIARAVAAVQEPALTRYHVARNGKSTGTQTIAGQR